MRLATYRGHVRQCNSSRPHAPHTTGHYSTVRYGELDYICPGAGEYAARVESWGNADTPAIVHQDIADTPLEVLRLIAEWWSESDAPLHAGALIGDDDRTIRQIVLDAIAKMEVK